MKNLIIMVEYVENIMEGTKWPALNKIERKIPSSLRLI
jgi:hypothetical protein